jgi:formylglycine-generating enzyme required for sulfatase activity
MSSLRSKLPILACGIILSTSAATSAVTFEWATVGNPGNQADSLAPVGGVDYEYRIAKHEVTNAQYVEFLNAVDPEGMNLNFVYTSSGGGISYDSNAANGSKYGVTLHYGDKPVRGVTLYDAMRFVNWLHNGQGAGDTESGVYDLVNDAFETRADGARFFIPNASEWYKAAYHQPAAEGGDNDGYWLYATGSNTAPTPATASPTGDISNPGANVANYDQEAVWDERFFGNVTTVGSAGPESTSFYGTYDQTGNVIEWTEAVALGGSIVRGGSIIGGSYYAGEIFLQSYVGSTFRNAWDTAFDLGFRVGSPIPEPASIATTLICLGMFTRRRSLRPSAH